MSQVMSNDKIVEVLTAELDVMVERVLAAEYHGLTRARDEGRASALALAIGMLTGTDTLTVEQESQARAMEKAARTEEAMEVVIVNGEAVLRRPWCDCNTPRPGFSRNEQGVWVKSCCGRRTKHAWLLRGNSLGPTLPQPTVSTGKEK